MLAGSLGLEHRTIRFLLLVNFLLVFVSCKSVLHTNIDVSDNNLAGICKAVPSILSNVMQPTFAGFKYPQVPLDVAGYPISPEGLTLEQVHVYVRHGERTPVSNRMHTPPSNIPEHWSMCHTARRFRASVSSYLGGVTGNEPVSSVPLPVNSDFEQTLHTRKLVESADGIVREGDCLLGELTDLGRQTTFLFGQNLRRLYVERLGLLPDVLTDTNAVYFRSTNVPRTMESLQHIIHGLYPTSKCSPLITPTILIRNTKDENLIGNSWACKRLEILLVGFAKAAAEAFNTTLEPLDKKVSKYIGGNPIRVDGKPRASGVMDTIRASIAHGVKVPPEFEDETITDVIEQAVVNEWFAGYKTEEVRRLGMGRLLSDMSRKMQLRVKGNKNKFKAQDQSDLKLLVHSTHDTALAGVCATLDVFDERWPAFTASIIFELFRQTIPGSSPPKSSFSPSSIFSRLGSGGPDTTDAEHYYVRARYQNKSLRLPLCAATGDHLEGHPEFCKLSAFQRRVAELTPVNWEEECIGTAGVRR